MSAGDFFEEGKRFFVDGKYEESIEAFTKAADAGYEQTICFLSRGVAYLKLHRSDDAIGDFSWVIDVREDNSRAYYYRGMARAQKGNHETAAEDFSRAIAQKPGEATFLFARGAAYIEMGKLEEAGQDIKNAANYLASASQGYANMIGDRTHLDKVLAVLEGERRAGALEINDAEFEAIRQMIESGLGKE
jgi:tetratricopeptide (TPR) repeat protein